MAFFRASTLTHLKYIINSFMTNVPAIYPLKTQKNGFLVFLGGIK